MSIISNSNEMEILESISKKDGTPQGANLQGVEETPKEDKSAQQTIGANVTPKGTPKSSLLQNIAGIFGKDKDERSNMEQALETSKQLSEFVKSKSNIHSTAKVLVLKLESVISQAARDYAEINRRLSQLEKNEKSPNSSKAQATSERKVEDYRKPILAKRSRPSPGSNEKSGALKKVKSTASLRDRSLAESQTDNPEIGWETVEQ